MQKIVEQYIEIGEFLQDGIALEKLSGMREKLQEQHFYLPIVGQFSSGKSSLINNLIGRRILPTMLSETTAFTTFIYYGETEFAEIVTANKSIKFEVEQLMALSQRNLQSPTSVSELLKIEPIQNVDIVCINVYLQHELFKTGIVLVDTPGLNTIISNHENRTIDIIPKAHAVLYIMGKALTAADVQLVSMIDQLGIDVLFVRTKLDELRKDENDTPKKIMQQDQMLLEDAIGRKATYFGVTNEVDLLVFPHWKELMDDFIQFLQVQFVHNIDEKKSKSVTRQLTLVKDDFLCNLNERKLQLEVSKSVTDQDIHQKIANLQGEIEYVHERIQKQEQNFHSLFEATKKSIVSKYEMQFKQTVLDFTQALRTYNTVEELQHAADLQAEQQIQNLTLEIKDFTNDKLNAFLKQSAAETNEALQDKIGQFSLSNVPNIQLQVDVPSVDDIFIQGEMIREKIEGSSAYDERIQEIAAQRQKMEQQAVSISVQMQSANEEMQQLGGCEAKYIQKQDTSSQETLSAFGNIVDIAMIFIPGKAFSTGAAKVAGVIKNVADGTKYVNQAAKIASGVEKAGKVLAKTDKIKDATKLLETAQNSQRGEGKESKFNILNLLSLEYWFGQVGKAIDGPPQIVEDEQHREAYLHEKSKIEAKVEHARQLELSRMQQLSLLETREEKLREEKRLQEKYEQQLKQEMFELEQKRTQQLKEQQVVSYRQQLIQQFELQLNKLLASYRENMQEYLARFIAYLPTVISLKLQQQLHLQKQQLEELTALRQQNKEVQVEYEQQLFKYLHLLNS
ncbi:MULTISPECIES: dynamin family protein [unclassified Exiguobacterium]|uniref:dynamin family protein n=1 Tax=unclassified Exiguobacterium TaxID=2644629 RepID=UPI001BE88A63|nr:MULTISPECIES: dynamin family protein [unclassified Exiguobacterium]